MTVAGLERGRYEINGIVGRGGMALVYRADDVEDDRPVAIKMLADNLAAGELGATELVRQGRPVAGQARNLSRWLRAHAR